VSCILSCSITVRTARYVGTGGTGTVGTIGTDITGTGITVGSVSN
jgi:hypothetical protein